MKTTIYEIITNQIVAAIEEGADLYQMPWHRSRNDIASPKNAATSRSYRGLNVISLWMIAEARQFSSGTWATYQQWQEKGAQVRKGEKSTSVFFWKNVREGEDESAGSADEEGGRARFVARAYNVFNADQLEGYEAPIVPVLPEEKRVGAADRFFASIPAKIEFGCGSACYAPSVDMVRMPPFGSFETGRAFYSVLAHELTHWSGAKTRLDRDLSGRFGSDAYAMEELVSELGAAFTAGQLALPTDPRRDNAPYIASWLKVLKGDSRAIFTAASKAQAAADYLASFQNVEEEMAA